MTSSGGMRPTTMKKRPSAMHETTRTFFLPTFLESRMRTGMLVRVRARARGRARARARVRVRVRVRVSVGVRVRVS